MITDRSKVNAYNSRMNATISEVKRATHKIEYGFLYKLQELYYGSTTTDTVDLYIKLSVDTTTKTTYI